MDELEYRVERSEGITRVVLHGELDMHLSPGLRRMFERELASASSEVVVDLGAVPFIDSSVIATLIATLKRVRAAGGKLRVENCQPAVRDTFELTRLTESFGIR